MELMRNSSKTMEESDAEANLNFEALKKLKSNIEDIIKPEYDDYFLIRWLKARNYDVQKAEEMLRNSIRYKERMKVASLLTDYDPPEVLKKYLAGGLCGFDKEGSPVLIELYGIMDLKGILYSTKTQDLEKTKLLLGEKVMKLLREQSEKLGHPTYGMTVIIDLEFASWDIFWGPGIRMYAHVGKILQENYPEIVKRTFIIKGPRVFPLLWKLFQPLITKEMKDKVKVLPSNYTEELLNYIDKEQLPSFLGGEMTDKDGNPRCSSEICQGGKVPESYYITDLCNTDSYKKELIPRGSKYEVPVHVTLPGSVLRYEFKTDEHDIGFGIMRNIDGEKIEEISIFRVNSNILPESGYFECKVAGEYTVIFDNSYSWTKSKNIWYSVDILDPVLNLNETEKMKWRDDPASDTIVAHF